MAQPLANFDDNRRRESRFGRDPDWDRARVRLHDGRELELGVLDESLGGLRLALQHPGLVAPGATLDVWFEGRQWRGLVRHVTARSLGAGWMAGVERLAETG